MKALLASTLSSQVWPGSRDRPRVKGWMKEIGERVKERMLGECVFTLVNFSYRISRSISDVDCFLPTTGRDCTIWLVSECLWLAYVTPVD
jgi:hypothetical protein